MIDSQMCRMTCVMIRLTNVQNDVCHDHCTIDTTVQCNIQCILSTRQKYYQSCRWPVLISFVPGVGEVAMVFRCWFLPAEGGWGFVPEYMPANSCTAYGSSPRAASRCIGNRGEDRITYIAKYIGQRCIVISCYRYWLAKGFRHLNHSKCAW